MKFKQTFADLEFVNHATVPAATPHVTIQVRANAVAVRSAVEVCVSRVALALTGGDLAVGAGQGEVPERTTVCTWFTPIPMSFSPRSWLQVLGSELLHP